MISNFFLTNLDKLTNTNNLFAFSSWRNFYSAVTWRFWTEVAVGSLASTLCRIVSWVSFFLAEKSALYLHRTCRAPRWPLVANLGITVLQLDLINLSFKIPNVYGWKLSKLLPFSCYYYGWIDGLTRNVIWIHSLTQQTFKVFCGTWNWMWSEWMVLYPQSTFRHFVGLFW